MTELKVNEVGSVGVVKDISSHRLQPNAWSDVKNVRFNNLGAHRVQGYSRPAGTPPIAPFMLVPYRPHDTAYWVVCGVDKIYQFDGKLYTNITRQVALADLNYSGQDYDRWNGSAFQGSVILNNGIDVPQAWQFPYEATKLIDLPDWPALTTARVVRPFKNSLVALYIIQENVFKPHQIMWSHPADPGTLPPNWDFDNPASDAGVFDLAETPDTLVDCLTLRNANIIYKEATTWAMTPSRNQFIYNFDQIFKAVGLLTQGCAVEYSGRHICVTANDIVIHDAASQQQSLIEKRLRDWLFANISQEEYHKSFLLLQEKRREVWFCFPEAGSTWCNKVIVISLTDGEWAIRDLPNISSLVWGPLLETSRLTTWDQSVGAWDSSSGAWGQPPRGSHFLGTLISAAPELGQIYKFDDTLKQDGINFQSYLERIDVPLGPAGQDGSIAADYVNKKLVQHVYPIINAPQGTAFQIHYGGRDDLNGLVIWQDSKTFRVGIDKKVDLWFNTKSLALRFSSEAPTDWTMEGYKVVYEMCGQ